MKYLYYLIIFNLLLACSSDDIRYEISSAGIDIKATAHSRFVSADSIDVDKIHVVRIRDDSPYRPILRLWGIGQPGLKTNQLNLDSYQEGWFLLKNKTVVLTFISEHEEAVLVPTSLSTPPQVELLLRGYDSKVSSDSISLLLGAKQAKDIKKLMLQNWSIK